MSSLTRSLAAFAAALDLAVPRDVIARAGDAFVDSLGVALGGSADPAARIARASIDLATGSGTSTIWSSGERARPQDAAFVNSVQMHVLDFDDSSLSLRGHPSSTMMPTAIAVAQSTGASGTQALSAYAIGLEVATRVARWLTPLHYLKGWHTTVTAGVFGTVAIAGRLLGLDETAMRHAFGLAASQASGMTRNFGSMAKAFQTGHAARSGIVAARLAAAGMNADLDILDGSQGFLALYGGAEIPPDRALLQDLGQRWELLNPGLYMKRWACCYAVHRPVVGLLELQAQEGFVANDIRSIAVGFLPGAAHPLNHTNPQSGLEGKFSIEYAMAAALLDGDLSLESFTDEAVQRPAAQALQRKVSRFEIPHEGVFNGLTGFNDLIVDTTRGQFKYQIDRTPGSPQWPLTPDELEKKFISCARTQLNPEAAHALYRRARALPDLHTVESLFD